MASIIYRVLGQQAQLAPIYNKLQASFSQATQRLIETTDTLAAKNKKLYHFQGWTTGAFLLTGGVCGVLAGLAKNEGTKKTMEAAASFFPGVQKVFDPFFGGSQSQASTKIQTSQTLLQRSQEDSQKLDGSRSENQNKLNEALQKDADSKRLQ